MDNVSKRTPKPDAHKAQVAEAASELLNESKKYANELYEDGMHRVHDVQEHAKEYSDQIVDKVRKNPMSSVLIAAGVGFLLSALLRK